MDRVCRGNVRRPTLTRVDRGFAPRFLESHQMRDKNNNVSRRGFIETAGAATGAMMAAGAFPHPAVGSVKGANEKINIEIGRAHV